MEQDQQDIEDIAARERQFEELIRDGSITPTGFPTAAIADLNLPPRPSCPTTRQDGTPCPWPTVDRTPYCSVHVGRAHHERASRVARASLDTRLWLERAGPEFLGDLAQLVAISVIQVHLDRRGVSASSSSTQEAEVKRCLEALAQIIAADLQPTPTPLNVLPDLAQRACDSMLDHAETTQTPFGDSFRHYAEGKLDWDEWARVVLGEFGRQIAKMYLDAAYRTALHGALGWEPDAGTSQEEIQRASAAVQLLQRIVSHKRRGRKPDDREERKRELQGAVDRVLARGEKLTRYALAAEMHMRPSGLDAMRKRHQLEIKDGRVEFSVIN